MLTPLFLAESKFARKFQYGRLRSKVMLRRGGHSNEKLAYTKPFTPLHSVAFYKGL